MLSSSFQMKKMLTIDAEVFVEMTDACQLLADINETYGYKQPSVVLIVRGCEIRSKEDTPHTSLCT